jgi:hypothetical protein
MVVIKMVCIIDNQWLRVNYIYLYWHIFSSKIQLSH